MNFEDITFVTQGPVHPTITKRSISAIREIFPGSKVILSTWEGQDVCGIDADEIIFNKDPSSSIFVYSKKNEAIKVNINRQITSSYQGLKAVKTKYAAKLRTDNILFNTNIIKIFGQYPRRDEQFSFLNQRLVCSNCFAKEFERGLPIPYFYSDLFQFGETEDLLKVWSIDHFPDYEYREALCGKKQHEHYPRDSIHVEQKIWSNFVNQFIPAKLVDEHGCKRDIENSRNMMINNLIVVDADILGLQLPERLQQNNGYPYEYHTYQRWQWQYEKAYGECLGVPFAYKIKWFFAMSWKWLRKGIRLKIRKALKR